MQVWMCTWTDSELRAHFRRNCDMLDCFLQYTAFPLDAYFCHPTRMTLAAGDRSAQRRSDSGSGSDLRMSMSLLLLLLLVDVEAEPWSGKAPLELPRRQAHSGQQQEPQRVSGCP